MARVGDIFSEVSQALEKKGFYCGYVTGRSRGQYTLPMEAVVRLFEEDGSKRMVILVREYRPKDSDLFSHPDMEQGVRRLAYQAAVGEVATGVLHNIGNLLNSVNIGTQHLFEIVDDTKIPKLLRANELFKKNFHCIQDYVNNDPGGKHLLSFYENVSEFLAQDQNMIKEELLELKKYMALIKDLIETQQDYARRGKGRAKLLLPKLIDRALRVENAALKKDHITVLKDYKDDGLIFARTSKVLHIFLNLFKNARESMVARDAKDRNLFVSVSRAEDHSLEVRVRDNGVGIAPEHLTSLFDYGFSTKQDGHGFGMFSCLQSMEELGGSIEAFSDGPSRGAEFKLVFPPYRPDSGSN